MCAINGIFAYHYAANPVDRDELVRVRDHMATRGPDGHGAWISDSARIALGHRRLAIIDLSDAASQPMTSPDGKLVITFNGEIYNYRSLRRELAAKGHVFRTGSDTEVLLHLYADAGPGMVDRLRGMYALAIWDAPRQHMFLARDPFGIKPLYYSDDGWTFRFASQVKALAAGRGISSDPDPAGIAGFYLLGSVPEPYTTLRSVRALPAGTTLIVDRLGAGEPRRFHSVSASYGHVARPEQIDSAQAVVRDALLETVSAHLVADVPVGAFLSSGVDSGAVVGLMRDAGYAHIRTLTVAFDEFRGTASDERPLAGEISRLYGTTHIERIVTRSEFEADLPRILDAMDQPSIDGVNTWFVSKAAREAGLKVALSGLGGDEIFGGYPSFRDIPRWQRTFAIPSRTPLLGKMLRTLGSPIAGAFGTHPKLAGLFELGGTCEGAYLLRRGLFLPWELGRVADKDLMIEGLRRLRPLSHIRSQLDPLPSSEFGRVAALETSLYMRNQLLRDTDWASMAHSLEVRVPLVDPVLLDRLAPLLQQLPLGTGKQLQANAPSVPLPSQITSRPKTGFTTPLSQWMRRAGTSSSAPSRKVPTTAWARSWSQVVARHAMSFA